MKTLFRFLILALISATTFAAGVRYNGITPDIIIDVRTPAEFSSGHITGAINIPVDTIGREIHAIKGLTKDSQILLYCRSGRRSAVAMQTLQMQGFKRVLDGGGIESLTRSLKQ